jgi:tRNA(Ile)-lysidine synthase
MKDAFNKYVTKGKLFSKNDKILAAISGGVDSVVMLHLLVDSGYKAAVGHCNFGLRGKESDGDEKFVRALAVRMNIPFYTVCFDTNKIAKQKGISVQMAARDLRYEWLEKTRKEKNYNFIAIAHHADDSIETFLINLIRGTGIAGLHGIKSKSGNVVRPLLFASRKNIEDFAKDHKIKYREDSSNKTDKYLRNKIRHQLIPLMKEMNPAVPEAINTLVERLGEAEKIIVDAAKREKSKIVSGQDPCLVIDLGKLMKLVSPSMFLYEYLKPYGYSGDVIQKIIDSTSTEDKIFFSVTHRIVMHGRRLNIDALNKGKVKESYKIPANIKSVSEPLNMKFSVASKKDYVMQDNKNIATLDHDRLKFPLVLRRWKAGDFFYPLGMKGKKKLSDFFTDLKLSLIDKENIWLLCSGNDIIWVVGYRIDHNFRITEKTNIVLEVRL